MKSPYAKTIALVVALAPFAASAQDAPSDCIALSPQTEVIQFATKSGPKYLLVRDGDARYRIDLFQPSEGASLTSPARISSQGLPHTLCPNSKNVVRSADGRVFWTKRIEPIGSDSYERIARRLVPETTRAAQAATGGSVLSGRTDQASR